MDLVKALPWGTCRSCSVIGDQAWLVESDQHTLPGGAYMRAFCKTRSAWRRETSPGNAKQECELLRGVVYNGSHCDRVLHITRRDSECNAHLTLQTRAILVCFVRLQFAFKLVARFFLRIARRVIFALERAFIGNWIHKNREKKTKQTYRVHE